MVDREIVAAKYGGSDLCDVDFEKAKVVFIPAPYEETVTYRRGTGNGPSAIFEASRNMELYDEELGTETYKIGMHTLTPLDISRLRPEAMIEKVYKAVKGALAATKLPVVIGGEHSVSIGAVKAAKEASGDISVLQLDAHYDLRDEYRGSRYNHACAGRRIQEIASLIPVGTRSISKEEKDFLSLGNNIPLYITAYDILNDFLWDKKTLEALHDKVYVTIDLDVLDPSIMPAVGTPEPGGLSWYLTLDILRLVAQNREIVGFDVVELAPLDGNIAPDFLASKLIYRFLSYILFGKKNGRRR